MPLAYWFWAVFLAGAILLLCDLFMARPPAMTWYWTLVMILASALFLLLGWGVFGPALR